MRLVQERAEFLLGREQGAARATMASNSTTPVEKFGAATTPIPAAATAPRTAASSASQPVVPMTMLMPRRASAGTLVLTAPGNEKSIATSTPRQRSCSGPPPWSGDADR